MQPSSNIPALLSPLAIRAVEFRNRIAVSPMCQYSSENGFAHDWHLVHLGSRAAGGAGLVFTEATAVSPEGRISPADLGIWDDGHIDFLARITDHIHEMGAVSGIQLAHAGRKASCHPPSVGGAHLRSAKDGAWATVAPSSIPFNKDDPPPGELDAREIRQIIQNFVSAAQRALKAGFKVIEIHSAHGYLLHEFLSPLSNQRTDEYGGILEHRTRLLRAIATEVRHVMPKELPLFVRISATDWVEGGWDLEQSVALARSLKEIGVDLIDCSSGAILPGVKVPVEPGFQVPFAEAIRSGANIMTGAVGGITEPGQANEILSAGKADMVLLATEMLNNPYWANHAYEALGQEPPWPRQYGFAIRRRKRK
jgi:2,4-dienoyl-CoA reductase (NADPH2)